MTDRSTPIQAATAGPAWTQDEAIAYEAARECITDLMTIHFGQLHQERCRLCPDAGRVAALESEVAKLHKQRASLRVTGHAEVARVRSEYGAIVRAWRQNEAQA